MKNNKFIEAALKIKRKNSRKIVNLKEELELVLMFLKGKVTVRQCVVVLGFKNPGSISSWATSILREALDENIVKIEVIKD